MNIMKELETKNLAASLLLEVTLIKDWTIWVQDGPSDETMLVSFDYCVGILKDDLLGYSFFPLPLSHLEQCGWVEIGKL